MPGSTSMRAAPAFGICDRIHPNSAPRPTSSTTTDTAATFSARFIESPLCRTVPPRASRLPGVRLHTKALDHSPADQVLLDDLRHVAFGDLLVPDRRLRARKNDHAHPPLAGVEAAGGVRA